MAKTYIIIRFLDGGIDPVITTREWLSTEKGWQWFINNNHQIEWVQEAKCLHEHYFSEQDEEVTND